VTLARHVRAAPPNQEIQIATGVRLLHVVVVEALVAARHPWWGCLPFDSPSRQFFIVDVQMKPSCCDIQFDFVAIAN
jgi:hypothetical protein